MFSNLLNPKNDVAFEKIFGTQKNQDILIHFLNDVSTFKGHGSIKEVTFLKTIQDPETAANKTGIVEMQGVFEKRAQYYGSKAYTSQAKVGSLL